MLCENAARTSDPRGTGVGGLFCQVALLGAPESRPIRSRLCQGAFILAFAPERRTATGASQDP
jgi:hypothetical protein